MAHGTDHSIDTINSAGKVFERSIRLSKSSFEENRHAIEKVAEITSLHAKQIGETSLAHSERISAKLATLPETIVQSGALSPSVWSGYLTEYIRDAAERSILMMDTFRKRGNTSIEHEEAGMPPVLGFDYELVADGFSLPVPVNYSLLKITPPKGAVIDDDKAPVLIIDPRAGHGAGIGGFKPESQVGEAFRDGHPVYFAAFSPIPVKGQTLANVRDAEVEFLRQIALTHPKAPKPILVGNCQGGWASMLVAASVPDAVGPIVINGAPMSYWAGKVGQNPMRYTGGLKGGAVPALLLADLGNGNFDGAALVSNFETLNPANTFFKKYYHLYSNIDTEAERFLEFERWWGGFYMMTEEEIHWIVENLFIGNKLTKGEAVLGNERIDLRRIKSPIIVFASHGDNITPPQQALNWIPDLYGSVEEIKARGQRIVYMIHDSIGHLGIFVSAKIAEREHQAITDTLRAIEALPPGLFEMKVNDGSDRTHILFEPRTLDDILHLEGGRNDDEMFASVAKLSEISTEIYQKTMRPIVKMMVTDESAKLMRNLQPQRTQRTMFSDRNPLMPQTDRWINEVKANRQPIKTDNPFLAIENLYAEIVTSQLDLYRDIRDAGYEMMFHSIYGSPVLKAFAGNNPRKGKLRDVDLRTMPEVQTALSNIEAGGVIEAVVRMLCLLTHARGYVRRTRLERELLALKQSDLFAGNDDESVAKLVHNQALMVDFEPELAQKALVKLLKTKEERRHALNLVMTIAGVRDTVHPEALKKFQEFEAALLEEKRPVRKTRPKKAI